MQLIEEHLPRSEAQAHARHARTRKVKRTGDARAASARAPTGLPGLELRALGSLEDYLGEDTHEPRDADGDGVGGGGGGWDAEALEAP